MLKLGKFYIDRFYIVAVVACGMLYFILPDKALDVLVCLAVVLGMAILDTLINGKMKGENDNGNE